MVGFSADGQRLAMLSRTTLRVFSLADQQTRDLPVQDGGYLAREPAIDTGEHWWIGYGAGTRTTAQIMFVDLDAPAPMPVQAMLPVFDPREPPRIALTTDAALGALSDAEGVGLWDLTDKAAPRKLAVIRPPEPGPRDDVPDLAFSRSGRYLVVGVARSSPTAGDVVIYDVATRKQLATHALSAPAHRVSFSPDERAIVVAVRECATVLYCHD
jgi:hypothetical protein